MSNHGQLVDSLLAHLLPNATARSTFRAEAAVHLPGSGGLVAMTVTDSAYLPFLQDWRDRLAGFGLSHAFVVAFDDGVVQRHKATVAGGAARVVAEARRLDMLCLAYHHLRELRIGPSGQGLDGLGLEVGEKDIVTWRSTALLLSLLGSRARVLFTEMDVFWVQSPMPLLDSLLGPAGPDTLLCASNRRELSANQCNVGMLAMRGAREGLLASALACIADSWIRRGSALGRHGQAAFNTLVSTRECHTRFFPAVTSATIDGLAKASSSSHLPLPMEPTARVHMLPPAVYALNQPRSPSSNPSWGPIARGLTASVHLTAMCFEKGCGAEPGGAKPTVLRALYNGGRWPMAGSYFYLADVHQPMVQLLVGKADGSVSSKVPPPITEEALRRAKRSGLNTNRQG